MDVPAKEGTIPCYKPEFVDVAARLLQGGTFAAYMSEMHMYLVVLYTKNMGISYEGDLLKDCELVHRWRDAAPSNIPGPVKRFAIPDELLRTAGPDARQKILYLFEKGHEF